MLVLAFAGLLAVPMTTTARIAAAAETPSADANSNASATRTPSERAWFEVVSRGGWSQFLLGFGDQHVWSPKIDLTRFETVELELRNLGGVDWSSMFLRPQSNESSMVAIGNYIDPGVDTGEWFKVRVPLTAFDPKVLANVSELAIYHRAETGFAHFGVRNVEFTGRSNLAWFGEGHSSNAYEADPSKGQMAAWRHTGTDTKGLALQGAGFYKVFEPIAFHLAYTNTTNVARTITINVELPDQVVHTSNIVSQGEYVPWPGRRHEWKIGSLQPGSTATADVKLFPLASGKPLVFVAQETATGELTVVTVDVPPVCGPYVAPLGDGTDAFYQRGVPCPTPTESVAFVPNLPTVPAVPGPVFTTGLDDVAVTVQSTGGITAADITIESTPSTRAAGALIADTLVSGVYDIKIPADAPKPVSATITIPYRRDKLAAVPSVDGPIAESSLRIYRFDETYGLWVLASDNQTVDAATGVATAVVDHFSIYTVIALDSRGFSRYWQGVAPECSASSGEPLDLVFVIDESGSMSDNDPGRQRVAASKALVDRLSNTAPGTRAAVLGFDDQANRRAPLTPLSASGTATVKAALDQIADRGNTNIRAGMQSGLAEFDRSAPNRRRIVVLLTDGQDSFGWTGTGTTVAADNVTVIGVALGSSADLAVLNQLAGESHGQVLPAATASELIGVFDSIGNIIVDNGRDSDSDGLSDCEEKNGMILSQSIYLPGATGSTSGQWIKTDPFDANTDAANTGPSYPGPQRVPCDSTIYIGCDRNNPFHVPTQPNDGRPDGAEMGTKINLKDPAIARDYSYLIRAGVNFIYNPTSDPTSRDSDHDGLYDEQEILQAPSEGPVPYRTNPLLADTDGDGTNDKLEEIQGTDPTVREIAVDTEYYGYPTYTLFQPEADRNSLVLPMRYVTVPSGFEIRFYSQTPVVWSTNDDCVTNCEPLRQWVTARYGTGTSCDNNFPVKWGCASFDERVRQQVRHAVDAQAIFQRDGNLRQDFLAEQATVACLQLSDRSPLCKRDKFRKHAPKNVPALTVAPAIAKVVNDTLKVDDVFKTGNGGGSLPRIRWRVLLALSVTGLADAVATTTTDNCVSEKLAILSTVGFVLSAGGYKHPCEIMPIFLPGGLWTESTGTTSTDQSTLHVFDAITTRFRSPALTYWTPAERAAAGVSGNWYNNYAPCKDDRTPGSGDDCDEYPYKSTTSAGPGTAKPGSEPWKSGGASLRLLPTPDNRAAGRALGRFYADPLCAPAVTERRERFLVIPLVEPVGRTVLPVETSWICAEA
jgi:Mg-chelatase subunit ChlD